MKKIVRALAFISLFISLSNLLWAQSGPGGIGNNDGSGTLKAWYKSDVGLTYDGFNIVTAWNNQVSISDLDLDVITGSPTYVPTAINTWASVSFDGSSRLATTNNLNSSYFPTDAASVFFVSIADNLTQNNNIFGSFPLDADRFAGLAPSSSNSTFYMGGVGNTVSTSYGSSGTFYIHSFEGNAADGLSIYRDNSLQNNAATAGTYSGHATHTFQMGDALEGDIPELIIFNEKVNTAQRNIVNNYLGAKYAIAIANDLYSGNDASYFYDIAGVGQESDGNNTLAQSAGLYLESSVATLDDAEYVIFGHNGTSNAVSTSDLPGGIAARWARDWYFDETGEHNVTITFDIAEGYTGGGNAQNISNYVLLYRSGTTGNYTDWTALYGISPSIGEADQVVFSVLGSDLADGYYTLGTADQTASPVQGASTKTWYTLVSGDWTDPSIWTLDPSGALPNNPDNTYPHFATDKVVIKTGKTIVMDVSSITCDDLTVNGRLDLETTLGHIFNTLRGTGKILMEGDNFPTFSGGTTHFITAGQGEGTVVLYGSSFELATALDFYNLEIDMDASNTMTLAANATINGNLTITTGTFQINNGVNATPLNIDVAGDVIVSSGSSISVGNADAYDSGAQTGYGNYHKGFHLFRVAGDLTNNGTVRLTNQTVPDYDSRATTGAVSLVFYGASNAKLSCNNTTDLYYLVIDKGTDRTYELELYTDAKNHFALFGDNNQDWDATDDANPENRKALWVANGTLRLTGFTYIPTLTEGGRNYSIGANAAFVLDGPNVFVGNTANASTAWSGLSHGTPSGVDNNETLQALFPFGKLQMNNGTWYQGASEAIYFRDEAAGILEVNGGLLEVNQIAIDAGATRGDFSFILTGGEVRITKEYGGDNSSALLNLDTEDMTFTMTGGELYINNVTTHTPNSIHIASTIGNYNVTGGTVYLNSGSTSTVSSTVPFFNLQINDGTTMTLQEGLSVLGDLTIQNNATLNAAGFDVSIGDDFDFADGAVYTHGGNTTSFIGRQSSTVYIRNTTNPGELVFNDVTINKNQRSNPSLFWAVIVNGGVRAASDHPIEIAGNLSILRGEFDVDDWEIDILGNISITDGQIVASATPGHIVLNGPAQQTLTGSAVFLPNFGRIELENSNGATIATDINMDYFIMTSGIMDIDKYRLSIDANQIEDNTAGGYDSDNMVMTNSESNARGLQFSLDIENRTYNNEQIAFFPVGVSGRYTPLEVTADGATGAAVSGTLSVSPVDEAHPAIIAGALDYYWRTDANIGDVNNNVITYTFYHDENAGTWHVGYLFSQGGWSGYNWEDGDDEFIFDDPMEGVITGDFTTVNVLVAIFAAAETYTSNSDGDWNTGTTWTPNGTPGTEDIVIIQPQHTVTINTANDAESGDLTVNGTLVINANVGSNDVLSRVSGSGTITMNSEYLPQNTNFEDFLNDDDATFEYSGGTFAIPNDLSVYPNLLITGSGATTKTLPNQDILVRKNLYIDDETLAINGGNELYILDSLIIDNDGVLQFPNTGAGQSKVTVNKSIDLSGNAADNTINIVTGTAGTDNHELYLWEDIVLGANSVIDLFDDAHATDTVAVDLYFTGNTDSEINDASVVTPMEFNRIIVDKSVTTADVDINEDFDLKGLTDGFTDEKALYLINGDLTLNNDNLTVNLTTGGSDFMIPSTTSLRISRATVNVSGTGTGILLDGYMRVGYNSTWNINQGTNNYIEYTASGSSEIAVYQGTLEIGSQIRRNELSEAGILNYRQEHANSSVVIGTDATIDNNSRGIFEILNTGSQFKQVDGATITIANSVNNGALPDFYLNLDLVDNPSAADIGVGSVIQFGNTDDTQSGQDITLYSNVDLSSIIVDNSSGNNPKVTMWTLSLTLTDSLAIEADAEFDANGLDLTLEGDFTNNGTFTHNDNSVYFSGTDLQIITGTTSFYNLTMTNPDTLILGASTEMTIENQLRLEDAQSVVNDNGNNIYALGSVYSIGTTVSSGSSDGITFNGSSLQTLEGTGTFARITVDNLNSVQVPTGNTVTVTDNLKLQQGVLDIGQTLLTLTEDANMEEASPFSETNMIQTNISFTDAGVQKAFPTIATETTFVYPMGSLGKYTPVTLTIDAITGGSIRVRAADERHVSILNDVDVPELVDTANVLWYHWTLDAESVTGFTATATMECYPGDIKVESPYTASEYITARLLNSGGGSWTKFDVADFKESTNELIFYFADTDDLGIDGDYTAGIDPAIPDQVPGYISITDGDWNVATTWDTYPTGGGSVPAGGPRGAIVYVAHDVHMPDNFMASYTTNILGTGTVDIGTSFGHRLGAVNGTGTLYIERGDLPAGVYDGFFANDSGTVEFGYTGVLDGSEDYDILSEITHVNNLTLSGVGERRFPNIDITIRGNLLIDGSDNTLSAINEHDQRISVWDDVTFNTGTFDAGTTSTAIFEFGGTTNQTIDGTNTFTGSNAFYHIDMNNVSGITLSQPVEITQSLTFSEGVIRTDATNILDLTNNTSDNNSRDGSGIVQGAGSNRYVDGPLNKTITSGGSFDFPVGDGGRWANISASSITASSTQTWQGQYYNADPATGTPSMPSTTINGGSNLNRVSDREYWRLESTSATTAEIGLHYDGQSGITANSDMRIAEWLDLATDAWEEVSSNAPSGNMITSSASTSLNKFTEGNFFTLATIYVPQTLVWDGSVDSDWDDADNWTPAYVPTAVDDVTIPDNGTTPNDPIITASAECQDLTIATSGLLTIAAGGSLTANGPFVNNGQMVLESPSNNGMSGSFIDNGSASGTGTVQIQRYISSFEYHYVSAPITGGNAQSNLFTTVGSSYNGNFYTFDETVDLDGNASTAPSGVYDPDNMVGGWTFVQQLETDPVVPMSATVGYSFYTDVSSTVTFQGTTTTLNTGDQSVSGLSYTDNDPMPGPLPGYYDGWHLVGNPYASCIDWDQIRGGLTNLDDAIYVWDGTQYASYVAGVSGGTGNQDNYIAPMQAFFVRAKANNAGFTLNNSHRAHSSSTTFKNAKANEVPENFLRLKVNGNGKSDAAVVYFKSNATEEFDGIYDAFRLFSWNNDLANTWNNDVPHLFTVTSKEKTALSINALPESLVGDAVVPLGVRIGTSGEYSITKDQLNFPGMNVYLIDKQENVVLNLNNEDTYVFNFDAGDIRDRFELRFRLNRAPVPDRPINNQAVNEDNEFDYTFENNTFAELDNGDEIVGYMATLSNGEELPAWLNFISSERRFVGTPVNENVGSLSIKISATDKHGAIGSHDFELEVINVNDAPELVNEIEDQQVDENDYYSFTIPANTFNDVDLGDALSLSVSSNDESGLPDWLTFDYQNGRLYGAAETYGDFNIIVSATDNAGASVSDEYTLTVKRSVTSLDEYDVKEIKIHPNPTKGQLKIETGTFNLGMRFIVRDYHGKTLLEKFAEGKATEINLSNFADGIYFIEMNNEHKRDVIKIILQK